MLIQVNCLTGFSCVCFVFLFFSLFSLCLPLTVWVFVRRRGRLCCPGSHTNTACFSDGDIYSLPLLFPLPSYFLPSVLSFLFFYELSRYLLLSSF